MHKYAEVLTFVLNVLFNLSHTFVVCNNMHIHRSDKTLTIIGIRMFISNIASERVCY